MNLCRKCTHSTPRNPSGTARWDGYVWCKVVSYFVGNYEAEHCAEYKEGK